MCLPFLTGGAPFFNTICAVRTVKSDFCFYRFYRGQTVLLFVYRVLTEGPLFFYHIRDKHGKHQKFSISDVGFHYLAKVKSLLNVDQTSNSSCRKGHTLLYDRRDQPHQNIGRDQRAVTLNLFVYRGLLACDLFPRHPRSKNGKN